MTKQYINAVFNKFTEEQKKVVYYTVGQAIKDAKNEIDLNEKKKYTPKKIIFNYPATIVFWEDGTKTVVKCSSDDHFDFYDAFTAALAKKIFGHTSTVKNIIDKKSNKRKILNDAQDLVFTNSVTEEVVKIKEVFTEVINNINKQFWSNNDETK